MLSLKERLTESQEKATMWIIICMVVKEGITETGLKLLCCSSWQIETEGVVSAQWVGASGFVNYA